MSPQDPRNSDCGFATHRMKNPASRSHHGVHRTIRPARRDDLALTRGEFALLGRLSTPRKIQAFLNAIPTNHEQDGETILSVREVLRQRRAHCIEGAFVAACALWMHGDRPLVMHMDCAASDYPHVLALFRRGGTAGAISIAPMVPCCVSAIRCIALCASWRCRIFTSTATGAAARRCAAIPSPSTCGGSIRSYG
jgi:hypothetical protein